MRLAEWFDLVDHPGIFLLAAIIAAPVSLMIGKLIFDDWDDFLDCLKTWYLPIWLSVWRGEVENIHTKFLAIAAWMLLSLLVTSAFYKGLLAATHLLHFGA